MGVPTANATPSKVEFRSIWGIPAKRSTSVDEQSPSYNWDFAFQVLRDLLKSKNGCVSSRALREELERHGVTDARDLVVELKFFDPESSDERGIPKPPFKFHHLKRSFYLEENYARELRAQEQAAAEAASDAEVAAPEEIPTSRTNRQEEARLVTYVKSALEDLYSGDATPDDKDCVFDVHSARAGGSFENVDLYQGSRVQTLLVVIAGLDPAIHRSENTRIF
jgi:hypothetical protein